MREGKKKKEREGLKKREGKKEKIEEERKGGEQGEVFHTCVSRTPHLLCGPRLHRSMRNKALCL